VSQDQIVAEYLDGRMSRRALIRRLVAGGVSFGAAVAYAQVLGPARAPARTLKDAHFAGGVEIRDTDLNKVIDKGGLKLRLTNDHAGSLYVEVHLLRKPSESEYTDSIVGAQSVNFAGPGAKGVRIPFDVNPPYSLKAVKRQRHRARFRVLASGSGGGGFSTFFDEAVIRR